MTARCFALIPAGGIGTRAGAAIPKQYLTVAGAPMIVHALLAFAAVEGIASIAVVVAPDDEHFARIDLDASLSGRVRLIHDGGATRAASVANGLAALHDVAADDDWVLVHDAARCGITAQAIVGMIGRVSEDRVGGLLAIPLDDTVKRATDQCDVVAATVDRRGLWRAQTPQMFRYGLLRDALATAYERGFAVTDEASAMEAAGHRVLLVPGSPGNFKVTTADDLAMMDVLLRDRSLRHHDRPAR